MSLSQVGGNTANDIAPLVTKCLAFFLSFFVLLLFLSFFLSFFWSWLILGFFFWRELRPAKSNSWSTFCEPGFIVVVVAVVKTSLLSVSCSTMFPLTSASWSVPVRGSVVVCRACTKGAVGVLGTVTSLLTIE